MYGKIDYAPETCGYCNGSGKNPHALITGWDELLGKDINVMERCPGCKGTGVVLVAQPPKKCVNCGGNGRHPYLDGKVCPSCWGNGWAFSEKSK